MESTFDDDIARYGRAYVAGVPVYPYGLDNFTEDEALNYLAEIREKYPNEKIERLIIKAEKDGKISLDFSVKPEPFQRIRRITGYLVGDMKRWGDAKRAEEHDRVKHM